MNDLFSAASRLGQLWASSPVVRAFLDERRAALTQSDKPPTPLRLALQGLLTSGSFSTQPLLTGWWLSALAQGGQLARMEEARPFLENATRTATAFLLQIEWLRSSLPGYPVAFLLPHLDPRASRVGRRGLPNQLLPWPMELRRQSLNLVPEINDQVARHLEVDEAMLAGPLLELRSNLWDSQAWREFSAARAALDDDAKGRLRALVDQFRSDCRSLDESASEGLMTDDTARRAATQRCEQAALPDEEVTRYYRAFRAIDDVIESVGALITQFAMGEDLDTVEPTQVTWRRSERSEVRFTLVNEARWFRVNQLVHVAASVEELQCLARIEGSTVSFDRDLGEFARHVAAIVDIGADATPDIRPSSSDGELLRQIRR